MWRFKSVQKKLCAVGLAEIDRVTTRAARWISWLAAAATLATFFVSGVLVGGCERRASESPSEPLVALHETPPVSLVVLCREPTRAWAVLDASGSIVAVTRGRCLGQVEHPEDGPLWHLVAQLQAIDAPRPSWELHTWVDDDGSPRYAEFRTPQLVTRFVWRDGAMLVRRLGDQVAIDDASTTWVTPNHALFIREVMLRRGVGIGPIIRQHGYVPERDSIAHVELTLAWLDAHRAQASAGASVLALEGDDAGLGSLRITSVVAGDRLVYRPLDGQKLAEFLPAVPKPRYLAPGDLTLTPIEIPSTNAGAPMLGGELVLASADEGKRPAVLFLGGAGPQDRHGFVPHSGVDLGSHELHDALARAGFAVLRFDDRGVGASEIGDEPTPGFNALVDDGRRALATLAARPEVDPGRIIVIGHGEGALHAAILAGEGVRVGGRKRSVAGLVLLAGPGRNLRELVYDEIRASLAGHREGEIRTVVDRAKRVHDAALADEDLPASSEGARQWMIEAFAEDPLARLGKVRAPVFAVQGGKDFQVSPERDFGPIRELIEARASKGSAAQLFPELDHLFKHEPGVSTPGHYADLRRRVDPAVIEAVIGWALGVCG